MKKNIFFACLFFASILVSCSKFTRLQKSNDVAKKYAGACTYYDKKDYAKASILLEDIIPLMKGQADSEPAQLKMAYCYYEMGQYSLSSFYFKRFYETFPRSKSAEEANYMFAYSLVKDSPETNLDQTNTVSAIVSMQNFINSYPQSERGEECTKIIKELRAKLEVKAYEQAKLYYKTSNYKAAIVAFTNFQKEFSDSDYIEEISYKKIETAYNYAKQSVFAKQNARFTDVVNFYQEFAEKYPQSKYLKNAVEIQVDCVKQLESIKKLDPQKPVIVPTQESQAGG